MNDLAAINELFPSSSATAQRGASSAEDMGSQDFLTLMVAQLENQDPTKPMDNMQFLGQLAQFGTVSGIQEMNAGFANMSAALTANQALQAASLVGRDVVTGGNVGQLRPQAAVAGEEPGLALNATVAFGSSAASSTLFIQDMSGRLVYSAALPPGSSGDLKVQWDGRDANGNLLAPGEYRVSAEAVVNGQPQTLSVYAHQRVESVAVDPTAGGVRLELAGGQTISINDVKSFL